MEPYPPSLARRERPATEARRGEPGERLDRLGDPRPVGHLVPVDVDREVPIARVQKEGLDGEELVVVDQPDLGPEHGGPIGALDALDEQFERTELDHRTDRRQPGSIGVDRRQRRGRHRGRPASILAVERDRTPRDPGGETGATEPQYRPPCPVDTHPYG
ncbi:hypothetical protein ACFQE8_04615 [Salinirubellus sp. GCM10025818]|uniref:hypothetical protein n=1 Tax=Salinirubellus TaxID=2162630 RepID=UPI0030D5A129